MTSPSGEDELLGRLRAGDREALAELFALQRDRLRRMVGWRLDPRLNGRLDPSDVLQEVYLDAARRLPAYLEKPTLPLSLWLRLLTGRRLLELHRQHLGGASQRRSGSVAGSARLGVGQRRLPGVATGRPAHLAQPGRRPRRDGGPVDAGA